jgi:hypothetical protein
MANVSHDSETAQPGPVVVLANQPPRSFPAAGPQALLDDRFVPQITELCQAMFPGNVTVESMVDPSEPGDPWLSFNVVAQASFAEIFKRESDWHEQVERLTNDRTGRYRLSVCPLE